MRSFCTDASREVKLGVICIEELSYLLNNTRKTKYGFMLHALQVLDISIE